VSKDDEIVAEIEQYLQRSGGRGVVYLEGASDLGVFFALLGVVAPLSVDSERFVHEDIIVRGLPGKTGSGTSAVQRRVAVAVARRYARVYGFVDGDGAPYDVLAREFDAPFRGPLFRWKGYSIENVLARTCWPGHWGREPDWARMFHRYAPYVALKRVQTRILRDLDAVLFAARAQPQQGVPLLKSSEVSRQLRARAHLLPKRDVLLAYRSEVAELRASTFDEQHARVNGKWLVEVLAPERTGRSKEQCRAEWIAEAAGRGGDQEVLSLWARVIRRTIGGT
jgi:hypothetical protein